MLKKLLLFFSFFIFSLSASAQNIAIVDVNFLINNSKAGKFIQKNLNDDNNKIIESLKEQEKNLIDQEKKLVTQKNVLSEEEFAKKIQDHRKKINNHNQERKNKLEQLNQKRAKGVSNLLKNLNDVLIGYSKENNIELIVDKKYTILSKNKNDITKTVLDLLDKKINKVNFN